MSPKRWVIGKMNAWHNGPFGGQCPHAGTPRECSRYGVRAVERFGAFIGVLLAARAVVTCRPELREALPKPQKGSCPFAFLGVLMLLVRLTLLSRRPPGSPGNPEPCGPGKDSPFAFAGALMLFVRLALLDGKAPPHRQCGRNDPHGR